MVSLEHSNYDRIFSIQYSILLLVLSYALFRKIFWEQKRIANFLLGTCGYKFELLFLPMRINVKPFVGRAALIWSTSKRKRKTTLSLKAFLRQLGAVTVWERPPIGIFIHKRKAYILCLNGPKKKVTFKYSGKAYISNYS